MNDNNIKNKKEPVELDELEKESYETAFKTMQAARGEDPQFEYLKKSGRIGWLKFKDIVTESSILSDRSDLGEEESVISQEDIDAWQEARGLTNEAVREAKNKRDDFAMSHQEDIGFGTKLLGSMVESITNPIDLGANIGVGVATGGLEFIPRLLVQGATDVASTVKDTASYEDRLPTAGEVGFTLAAGALPDIAIAGMPKFVKYMKKDTGLSETLSNIAHNEELGDIKIKSPMKQIIENDNMGNNPKATQQSWQTEYGKAIGGVDHYNINDIEADNILERNTPSSNYLKDKLEKLSNLNGGNIDDLKKSVIPVVQDTIDARSRHMLEDPETTVLDRYVRQSENFERVGYMAEWFVKDVPKDFTSNKTPIQKLVNIQNKYNDRTKELAANIAPTIKDHYERWKIKNANTDKPKDIPLNYEQIRRGINKMDSSYNTQKINVQNEYRQKLGRDFKDFIKEVEPNNVDLSKAWINGKGNTLFDDFAKKNNCERFLQGAYDDSIKLDSLTLKTNLFDNEDFTVFSKKYGESFDADGDFKYDGNFFKNVKKAKTAEDKELLFDALENSNPQEYADFIFKAKQHLDNSIFEDNKDLIKKASIELKELKAQKVAHRKDNLTVKIEKSKKKYQTKIDKKTKEIEALTSQLEDHQSRYDKSKKKRFKDKIDRAKKLIKNRESGIKKLKQENILVTKDIRDTFDKKFLDTDITAKKEFLDSLRTIKKEYLPKQKEELISYFGINESSLRRYMNDFSKDINARYKDLDSRVVKDELENYSWTEQAMDSLNTERSKLAEESIKINQTVNKQLLIKDLESYYTKDGKVLDIDKFNSDIKPYYDDNILVNTSKVSNEDHFAILIKKIKKTRASAKWTGDRLTIGELRHFFGENQMANFFTRIGDGKYLKKNYEMVMDIVDFNTSKTARFMEYGSVSPYVLKNKIDFQFKKDMSDILGKTLSQDEKKVTQSAINQLNNFLRSTHLKGEQGLPTGIEKISKEFRTAILRGVIGWTGTSEISGPNQALALMRAQRYGGLNTYENVLREGGGGNLVFPKGKYIVSQAMEDTDFSAFAKTSVINKYDRKAMFMQKLSDIQMHKLGEAHTVSLFDNLPSKWDSLENEFKDVLRMNKINESNYVEFSKFAKSHIKEHNLTVNISDLSRNSEIGVNTKFNNALRDSYYQISQHIGDIKYDSKFYSKANQEIFEWYTMFRGFSRALNKDLLDRIVNYTNANGVSKSKFSKDYISDMGVAGVAKDFSLGIGTGLGLLIFANQSDRVVKELTASNRTMDQKIAVTEQIPDQVINVIKDGNFIKILELAALNPNDILSATDIPETILGKIKKIYDTFTDEEKKLYGTNKTEGLLALGDLIINYFGSRVLLNIAKAGWKYYKQGDVESMPNRIYGFSKEEVAEIYSRVNAEQLREIMANERKVDKANIDFLNNSNESYDKMPMDKNKKIFEEQNKLVKDKNIQNRNRQYYAINFSDGSIGYNEAGKSLAYATEGAIQMPIKEEPKQISKVDKADIVDGSGKKLSRIPAKVDLENINNLFSKARKEKSPEQVKGKLSKMPDKVNLDEINNLFKQKQVSELDRRRRAILR